MEPKRFKVALSFCGDYREYVQDVAEVLSHAIGRDSVFYDKYYEAELARPNLDVYLSEIYAEQSEISAVFFSEGYVEKEWCGLEWRTMRESLKRKNGNDIMPLKFDDTDVEGLLSLDGYIDISTKKPFEVAHLILQRLESKSSSFVNDHQEAKDEIEIVLDVDFESFDHQRERNFLDALALLLKDSDVTIKKKRAGSTVLTLQLTRTQWGVLKTAIEDGSLDKYRATTLRVNGVVVSSRRAASSRPGQVAESGAPRARRRMTIYVGNLPYSVTEADLRSTFAEFGHVSSVNLITDKFSGNSKGFGFVEMENEADASKAIKSLNESQIMGKPLQVKKAKRKTQDKGRRGAS